MTSRPTALLEALRPLPDSATVPVGWIRERLGIRREAETVADLTVEDLAEQLGRSRSSARELIRQIPGAYRLNGKEWRVPAEAARAHFRSQRTDAVGLGGWRDQRQRRKEGVQP